MSISITNDVKYSDIVNMYMFSVTIHWWVVTLLCIYAVLLPLRRIFRIDLLAHATDLFLPVALFYLGQAFLLSQPAYCQYMGTLLVSSTRTALRYSSQDRAILAAVHSHSSKRYQSFLRCVRYFPSKSSAEAMGVEAPSPPVTSTFPLGRSVSVCEMRSKCMSGAATHCPVRGL